MIPYHGNLSMSSGRHPAIAALSAVALPSPVRLVAAAIALLPGLAHAQVEFAELRKEHALPDHRDQTWSVVLGDLDGDGDLDLVVGNEGQHRLYRNDGSNSGIFVDITADHLPPGGGGRVALGDVDGDGDPDLVLGDRGQLGLLLNEGDGHFYEARPRDLPIGGGGCVTLGDVDRDGDLDLAIGQVGAQNRLYLNDGAGAFSDDTGSRMPVDADPTVAIALGDVDGDGDLDMALVNNSAWVLDPFGWTEEYIQDRLYLNDGTGHFADGTDARMPIDGNVGVSVALGDVDGDGDLDMVVGNELREYESGQTRLYLNDGAGFFTDATAARLPVLRQSYAVALGDVDKDGDLDLVAGQANYAPEWSALQELQNRLLLNDGSGGFSDATVGQMPVDVDPTTAVAMGDVDGDGDLDLVLGNVRPGAAEGPENRLYVNDGNGVYNDVTAPRIPRDYLDTKAVALGDIDGDGDLDMVLGNQGRYGWGSRTSTRLWLNDGDGRYSDETATRLPSDSRYAATLSLALGDVDGDGDLDLVMGTYGYNQLLLNDGHGFFGPSAGLPAGDPTMGVALGDVDGDGDLDLICANAWPNLDMARVNRLYLNDGTGVFHDATALRMPNTPTRSLAVALGDVDGDGDLDIVFGNSRSLTLLGDAQNQLFLNDGSGTFSDVTVSRMPLANDSTNRVALGDVDGDGDLDLIAASNYFGVDQGSSLLLNDGSGTFTDAPAGWLKHYSAIDVALGDVDEDGDIDLIFVNNSFEPVVHLNNGLGTFPEASRTWQPPRQLQRVALGDVDGDGDLDLAFAGRFEEHVLQNLMRQLDSPLLLRVGRSLTLDGYARGWARTGTVAIPVASFGRARVSLPMLGILGIDLAQATALPRFVIPSSSGHGSITFRVPGDVGLVGRPVYCQALLLQDAHARLTNVTADVFVP